MKTNDLSKYTNQELDEMLQTIKDTMTKENANQLLDLRNDIKAEQLRREK